MSHFNDEISIIPLINEVEDYPDYIPASKLHMKFQPSTSLVYIYILLYIFIFMYIYLLIVKLFIKNSFDNILFFFFFFLKFN